HLGLKDARLSKYADKNSIEEVVDWVISTPNLKKLTLMSFKPDEDFNLGSWLKSTAQVRVELQDATGEFLYDNPVRAIHFPRGKTLENLRLMARSMF
ncbi:hypothetical protein FRC02_006001, partial [Tulasnella sp. 418]